MSNTSSLSLMLMAVSAAAFDPGVDVLFNKDDKKNYLQLMGRKVAIKKASIPCWRLKTFQWLRPGGKIYFDYWHK